MGASNEPASSGRQRPRFTKNAAIIGTFCLGQEFGHFGTKIEVLVPAFLAKNRKYFVHFLTELGACPTVPALGGGTWDKLLRSLP